MRMAARTAILSPSSRVKVPDPVGLKKTIRSASPSMLTHLQQTVGQALERTFQSDFHVKLSGIPYIRTSLDKRAAVLKDPARSLNSAFNFYVNNTVFLHKGACLMPRSWKMS